MTLPLLDDETQPSVTVLFAQMRRRWKYAAGCIVALTLVMVIPPLLGNRQYTAFASFVPQARRHGSLIAGFAAQLGVDLPSEDATQSPQFYAELARSPGILNSLVRSSAHDRSGRAVNFATYYKISDSDTAVAREKVIDRLKADLVARVAAKTLVVEIEMTADDPILAKETVERVLDALEQYNANQRRSQATAERRFAERRLQEVRAELSVAEGAQMRFLESNRDFKNSPTLAVQQERLAREVTLKQQVFTSLTQAVEQARLEEVRDTPVLSIVQPVITPARPKSRKILTRLVIAIVGGTVLGILGFAVGLLTRDTLARASRLP